MLIRFVVNPRATRISCHAVETLLREEFQGWNIEIETDLARRDRDPRPGMVVAVGGDGTVHSLLDRLSDHAVPLGILPCGRANDFARALGIPADLRHACAIIRDGARRDVDLITVNGRRLATCGGLGLVATVSARANGWRSPTGWRGWLARSLGAAVYPAAMAGEILRGWSPVAARIEGPGDLREVNLAALLVSNQPRFGGRLCVSPEASNRDGRLHLCEIRTPRRRRRMLGIGLRAWTGGLGNCPEVTRTVATEITVTTARDQFFYGDGEPMAWGRRFRIRVEAAALRVVVPQRADPATWEADHAA